MGKSKLSELRESYKPSPINVLFVGESPPVGGTFFYRSDSNLARYTRAGFASFYNRPFESGDSFLRFFQGLGCYLDDLCVEPVNQLTKHERHAVQTRSVPGLAKRLRESSPRAIVIVMAAISRHVQRAALQADISVPIFTLPFPAMGHQQQYVRELTDVLRQLSEADMLASEHGWA